MDASFILVEYMTIYPTGIEIFVDMGTSEEVIRQIVHDLFLKNELLFICTILDKMGAHYGLIHRIIVNPPNHRVPRQSHDSCIKRE